MPYKYKLSEMSKSASPEEAEKELGIPKRKFEVGQVTYSDDGQRKSEVTNINPETGTISWKVTQLPGFDKLYDEMDGLVDVAKRVYTKTKNDKKFREFYESARKLRNAIRTHLRNEYPDEYKRITRVSEAVEPGDTNLANATKLKYNNAIGTSADFADAILDIWNELSGKENDAIVNTNALKQAKALLVKQSSQEEVDEMSTSGGAGAYLTPYAFRLKGKKPNIKAYKELGYEEVKENQNPGATLGPGPKAGPDGVTDNYYVKGFKYKLVPKKIKNSGIITKKLF